MKIVIDIHEKDYECLKRTGRVTYSIMNALLHGTPLPKNHGRLIDADVLADGFEDNYEFCEALNATPTIIEAERTE